MTDQDDDPITMSISSGYVNDPLAYSMTRSGKRIWTYPAARARFEANHPEEVEWQKKFAAFINRIRTGAT